MSRYVKVDLNVTIPECLSTQLSYIADCIKDSLYYDTHWFVFYKEQFTWKYLPFYFFYDEKSQLFYWDAKWCIDVDLNTIKYILTVDNNAVLVNGHINKLDSFSTQYVAYLLSMFYKNNISPLKDIKYTFTVRRSDDD